MEGWYTAFTSGFCQYSRLRTEVVTVRSPFFPDLCSPSPEAVCWKGRLVTAPTNTPPAEWMSSSLAR